MRKLVLMFLLAALVIPAAVYADTVSGGGGSFQGGWVTSDAGNAHFGIAGPTFFDNLSTDGSRVGLNAGWCIAGGGNCVMPGGSPGVLPVYSVGPTFAAPGGFFFVPTGSSQGTLKIEIAGRANSNTFGFYNLSSPGTLNQLFSGPQGPGSTFTFTPSGNYGFYLGNSTGNAGTPGPLVFTTSHIGSDSDPNNQHFAVFYGGKTAWGSDIYYIAVEDLPFFDANGAPNSDRDYNDMVIKIFGVPEPASLLLFGSGLVGLAGIARRKLSR